MIQRDDIIYGRNPVIEAIKADREINKIFLANDSRDSIFKIARDKGIVVVNTDRKKLDRLAGTESHQGVVAQVSPYVYYEPEELLEEAKKRGEAPLLIILDELTDDNNLANIIRSAEAFGAHGIIIPKRNSASLNSIVAKRSAGAAAYIKLSRVTNLSRVIEELKEQGIWIYAAEAGIHADIRKMDLKGPMAIVIGSEGSGVARLVREKCDGSISISTGGKVGSLNAANAAAIILYEIYSQRNR